MEKRPGQEAGWLVEGGSFPEIIRDAVLKLLAYCQANNWEGYDPYDALNSRIFTHLPFLNSRLPRLALTQALKRIPVNVRPLLLIPKTQNPKAIALFLMAFIRLDKLGLLEDRSLIPLMIQRLIDLRSPSAFATRNPQPATRNRYYCWGYSFPWQTRTMLVPKGAPNLVCTTLVANALLDLYETSHQSPHLSMAVSAAEYLLNELYWAEGGVACFSYPLASSRSRVHNANFLAAALLCRVSRLSGEGKFMEPALEVARYSAARQHDDGSWDYGELPTQQWVDNFHTGYNLCALHAIGDYAQTSEFQFHLLRGMEFYRQHFFREDGAPKYFHDRTYPIDIHAVAQSIITLLTFRDLHEANLDMAQSVLNWTMAHLWDEQGFFYYRKLRTLTIKIPYMRWSQAWMLLALATLLRHCDQAANATEMGERLAGTGDTMMEISTDVTRETTRQNSKNTLLFKLVRTHHEDCYRIV